MVRKENTVRKRSSTRIFAENSIARYPCRISYVEELWGNKSTGYCSFDDSYDSSICSVHASNTIPTCLRKFMRDTDVSTRSHNSLFVGDSANGWSGVYRLGIFQ